MKKVFVNFCDYGELLTVRVLEKILHGEFSHFENHFKNLYGHFTPQNFAVFKNDEVMQYFDFAPCSSNTPKTSTPKTNDPSISRSLDYSRTFSDRGHSSPGGNHSSHHSSSGGSHSSHHVSSSGGSHSSHDHFSSLGGSLSSHLSLNNSDRRSQDHFSGSYRYSNSGSSSLSCDTKCHNLEPSKNCHSDGGASTSHSKGADHHPNYKSFDSSDHNSGSPHQSRISHGDGSESTAYSGRADHYSDLRSKFSNHHDSSTDFDRATPISYTKLETKLSNFEEKVDSRFQRIEKQVSSLEGNFHNLQKQIPILQNEKYNKLENRITHLDTKMDLISSRIDSFEDNVGRKMSSLLQTVETLENLVKDVALSVQKLRTQPPCSCDKSVQRDTCLERVVESSCDKSVQTETCLEGVVESSVTIASDNGGDQGSLRHSPPIHPKLSPGSVTPDTDLFNSNNLTPLQQGMVSSTTSTLSVCTTTTKVQAMGRKPIDQPLSSTEEDNGVSPIPPVLFSPQVSVGMTATSTGSRNGLLLKERRMDEQVLEGESDPPIPSDLTYPWRLPPWPGDGQTSPDQSLPSGDEMVGTFPTLGSVPAFSPIRKIVDTVHLMAFLSNSRENGSGLSMKEMRVGAQVPGGDKSHPGDPLVSFPLTHLWCLPPWPPPV